MPPFSVSCPTQIRFGAGTRTELPRHLPDGARHCLLVRGGRSDAAKEIEAILKDAGMTVQSLRCGGEPSVGGLNQLRHDVAGGQVDAIIACGGGSVIDTGKALSFVLSHDMALPDDFKEVDQSLLGAPGTIPCIALPTTAGTGAEVTANAVLDLPSRTAKVSLRGRALYPTVAIVDPDLIASCPPKVMFHAGLDAITQVVEAYTSNAATPFSDALSAPAIAKGLAALPLVLAEGDPQARSDMAWVSLSSGLALANAGLGAAHGIASVLGSRFGASHGALCGRLLVPVLRQNAHRAVAGTQTAKRLQTCQDLIATAFPPQDDNDPLGGFEAWINGFGLARLKDWGVPPDDFVTLASASAAASSSQKNAVPLEAADYVAILAAAH